MTKCNMINCKNKAGYRHKNSFGYYEEFCESCYLYLFEDEYVGVRLPLR